MSYRYSPGRPLGTLGSCDYADPSAPSVNSTPEEQKAASAAAIAEQQKAAAAAHQKASEQVQAYAAGLQAINESWSVLPMSPYPPASDTTGFPRTGDPRLVLIKSQVTAAALAEPGRVTAGMLAQAQARRPHVGPLFWVGLVCLGVGIYVARH